MPGLTRLPKKKGPSLKLKTVGGKKVKSPKGTKTVTQSGSGKLVYKDKAGKPIKKRGR